MPNLFSLVKSQLAGDVYPTISGEKGQYTLIVACHALFMAH